MRGGAQNNKTIIKQTKIREHTRAAAQARQKRIVHWVTHRGKEIEVTKISRARRTGWT